MDYAKLDEVHQENRMSELKVRIKNCCCRYCGGKLKLKRIFYGNIKEGRVEIFCSECDRIEYGVDKEIYLAAKHYVDEFGFSLYPGQDVTQKTYQINIAKICDIIAWGFKSFDLLGHDGFKVPVNISTAILGEEIIFTEEDMENFEIEDLRLL